MNHKQAAKLKIGDRVHYDGTVESAEDACPGTVIEANWHAVKIKYDDGVVCILHHRDMDEISRLEERYDVTRAIA
jgi:tartrate dehydratase beta subunit/fumarate hydratase class I family protein